MQTVDGYLIVPYVARRTVDLAPALVLAAQLMFGALFGFMGLLLADPIVATIKTALEDLSKRKAMAAERRRPDESKAYWPGWAAPAVSAALGTTCRTWTSNARSSLGPIGLPCGGFLP